MSTTERTMLVILILAMMIWNTITTKDFESRIKALEKPISEPVVTKQSGMFLELQQIADQFPNTAGTNPCVKAQFTYLNGAKVTREIDANNPELIIIRKKLQP